MTRSAAKLPVAVMTALVLTMTLADCAKVRDSRLNPFNWFGRSRAAQTQTVLAPNEAADGRQLIQQVTALEVTKTNYGAIVQAKGLPPTQGWWKAELKADNRGKPDENGVVTYRFLVFQPPGPTPVSTVQSRELTAAAFLSTVDLDSISQIVVQGELNSRSSGR
ncbi:MAG: hypothetical protein WAT77_05105 [Paracoccaceae bacterium]|jgi:hypothetical protein